MSILDNKVRIVFADYLKRGAYGEVEDMYLMMRVPLYYLF